MPVNAAVADVLALVGAVLIARRARRRRRVRRRPVPHAATSSSGSRSSGSASRRSSPRPVCLVGLARALLGRRHRRVRADPGLVLAIPLAIGVAILRYRLYDVDRVISRSLTYGLVTITLAAAYAALVLTGQALFSSFAGGSNLAIAVSTLVVAALFLPVRARAQRFVDRRFYRRRYDAAAHAGGVRGAAPPGGRARRAPRRPAGRRRARRCSRPTSRLWLREEAR